MRHTVDVETSQMCIFDSLLCQSHFPILYSEDEEEEEDAGAEMNLSCINNAKCIYMKYIIWSQLQVVI